MIPTEPQPSFRLLDQTIVVIANVINLLIVGVFTARAFGRKDFEHRLGLALIFFSNPKAKTKSIVILDSGTQQGEKLVSKYFGKAA